MAEPSPSTPERMIQGLELLRQLASSLEQSQAALAMTTPLELDHHTAQQQELCQELRALAGGFSDAAQVQTPSRLANDLQVAVRQVGDLNRKYAALLRRGRRTIDIFCRVLASSGTTYPAPKVPRHPDAQEGNSKE